MEPELEAGQEVFGRYVEEYFVLKGVYDCN